MFHQKLWTAKFRAELRAEAGTRWILYGTYPWYNVQAWKTKPAEFCTKLLCVCVCVSDVLCESFVTAQSAVPREGQFFFPSLKCVLWFHSNFTAQSATAGHTVCLGWINPGPFAKPLRNVLSLMKCVSSAVNRAFMELNESEFSRKTEGIYNCTQKTLRGMERNPRETLSGSTNSKIDPDSGNLILLFE